ncbi:MAG: lipid biosynthesis acyltransferase [Moraxellaceae bacterium]|jgi:KDO2-lipid IV(A) lauroyltransferase|nr:lipid biosynthesis acyltransferase [Moraxellaceae bacterium]
MNDIPSRTLQELSGKERFYLRLLRFFSRLPLGFLQRMGAFIAGIAILVGQNSKTAHTVRRNLELCFPEQTPEWRERILRENIVSTAMTALEMAKTWGSPPAYSLAQIKAVHDEHIFHAAIAAGRGTIAIVPHFGTWEFMNAWLNERVPSIIMYKPGKDKGVDTFVLEARSRLSATLVPADERGVKALFKGLRQNRFCAILPDHVPHDNGGIFAPFFGVSTWTGVMVPKLVGRTGCRVVVMACLRRSGGDGFEIFFSEPDPAIYSEDVATSTAAMNRTVENVILTEPAQYQWTYKRFKKVESGEDVYARPRR